MISFWLLFFVARIFRLFFPNFNKEAAVFQCMCVSVGESLALALAFSFRFQHLSPAKGVRRREEESARLSECRAREQWQWLLSETAALSHSRRRGGDGREVCCELEGAHGSGTRTKRECVLGFAFVCFLDSEENARNDRKENVFLLLLVRV